MPEARTRLLDGQCATPTSRGAEAGDLGVVGHHAMSEPRPVRQPTRALEVLRRAAAEALQRVGVVLGVLGEVGVQTDVEALGELDRAHHQRLGHRERRARGEGDAHHRPEPAVVMTGDCLLAGGEDVVVVGHDVVGRQAAVLLRQRHRAAGGMEAHAEIRGGVDLGGEQVAGAAGMDVEVVRRRRATRQGELGEADPRRQVRALGVEAGPQRIQRLQPAEQAACRSSAGRRG